MRHAHAVAAILFTGHYLQFAKRAAGFLSADKYYSTYLTLLWKKLYSECNFFLICGVDIQVFHVESNAISGTSGCSSLQFGLFDPSTTVLCPRKSKQHLGTIAQSCSGKTP